MQGAEYIIWRRYGLHSYLIIPMLRLSALSAPIFHSASSFVAKSQLFSLGKFKYQIYRCSVLIPHCSFASGDPPGDSKPPELPEQIPAPKVKTKGDGLHSRKLPWKATKYKKGSHLSSIKRLVNKEFNIILVKASPSKRLLKSPGKAARPKKHVRKNKFFSESTSNIDSAAAQKDRARARSYHFIEEKELRDLENKQSKSFGLSPDKLSEKQYSQDSDRKQGSKNELAGDINRAKSEEAERAHENKTGNEELNEEIKEQRKGVDNEQEEQMKNKKKRKSVKAENTFNNIDAKEEMEIEISNKPKEEMEKIVERKRDQKGGNKENKEKEEQYKRFSKDDKRLKQKAKSEEKLEKKVINEERKEPKKGQSKKPKDQPKKELETGLSKRPQEELEKELKKEPSKSLKEESKKEESKKEFKIEPRGKSKEEAKKGQKREVKKEEKKELKKEARRKSKEEPKKELKQEAKADEKGELKQKAKADEKKEKKAEKKAKKEAKKEEKKEIKKEAN
eukprot:TRINITY_DN12242_c0_g1_i7.p1 TRINITY_DN12242_c0_g1~~TRINITY_DN12242_c0_g1_i7.p1  ORF type:complete len:507 (-),score=137.79 TRINITY_DN12242_c0_g1_i7:28-1548(-)